MQCNIHKPNDPAIVADHDLWRVSRPGTYINNGILVPNGVPSEQRNGGKWHGPCTSVAATPCRQEILLLETLNFTTWTVRLHNFAGNLGPVMCYVFICDILRRYTTESIPRVPSLRPATPYTATIHDVHRGCIVCSFQRFSTPLIKTPSIQVSRPIGTAQTCVSEYSANHQAVVKPN
jgi:hypothetical protein